MKRIDSRTVELTSAELEARTFFDAALDAGQDIPTAANRALLRMRRGLKRGDEGFPSDEFIEYLSEGTCERWGDTVHIKPEWRHKVNPKG